MQKSIGVLFDYNGVIFDDEHIHEEAFKHTVSSYGLGSMPTLYRELCLGKTDREGFEELRKRFPENFANESIEVLVTKKQKEYERLSRGKDLFHPQIKDIINNVTKFAKLGVVTGAGKKELEHALKQGGILDAFEALITAEDITKGKPSPEGYIKGAKALGLPKNRIVAIEDSGPGVRAAKSAGIKCIGVLHTSTISNLSLADTVVKDVSYINQSLIEKVLGAP